MRACVHRGTREIGGTCVEVEAHGDRIVLDLGLPLDSASIGAVPLPNILGLREPDPSLRAIVLSHGHRDHWGLLPKISARVPVVMGAATERVMRAAAPFVPDGFAPTVSAHLTDRKPLQLGAFTITPYLADHSGFDAYSILVEAEGKRLFYSGDIRSHGRKGALFNLLIRQAPQDIDVMLMEGSSLGRIADDQSFQTEDALENVFLDRFKSTSGAVLVVCSAQNIDRVVTVYRAAKRSNRQLVVDAYGAEVLRATGYPTIPKPADDWTDVKVFIPQRQRIMLLKRGIAALVDAYRGRRIWPRQLAAQSPKSVFLIRPWMFDAFERLGVTKDARVIWSQWEGYLKDGQGLELREKCEARRIPFEVVHTSGHASPGDLKRLAEAINPKKLVAIHTFARERFPSLFRNVLNVDDGQWVEV